MFFKSTLFIFFPRPSVFQSANIRLDSKGFTIFEMLIAVGITVSLAVVLIANFRNFETKTTLFYEAEKVVSVIRNAQIWALTGQLESGTRPAGGYGVRFNQCSSNCSYIFFADRDGDHSYDEGEALLSGIYLLAGTVVVPSLSQGAVLDIVFEPPQAAIYFNGNPSPDSVDITLQHRISSEQKVIRLNRVSGRINIE